MACSCFCWKRHFQRNYEQTEMPEFEGNAKKVTALESKLNKVLRELEQLESHWMKVHEVTKSFGEDMSTVCENTEDAQLKEEATQVGETCKTVQNERKAGTQDVPNELLQKIKKYRQKIYRCRTRSTQLRKERKDYDAHRAVLQDREAAVERATPKKKEKRELALRKAQDTMYDAETNFRATEREVSRLQQWLLENADLMLRAAVMCFAGMQAERVAWLSSNWGALTKISEGNAKEVLERVQAAIQAEHESGDKGEQHE